MYVIGIDVGTTGAKACVIDTRGAGLLATGYSGYTLDARAGGIVEQDAEAWFTSSAAAVREAVGKSGIDASLVGALSMSAQGSTLAVTGPDGLSVTPAITWMDTRAVAESDALLAQFGGEVYEKSGWNCSPLLDAAKIMWLRRNRPEIFSRAACFPSTLGYMARRLTGRCAEDPTAAAIRNLCDFRSGGYADDILDYIGVGRDRLPELIPTGAKVGGLTPEAAAALGLPSGTPVYNGAHDQYCAALGSGTVEPRDMLVATGTAWVILGVTTNPLYTESRLISPCVHPASDKDRRIYGAMCSLETGGSALKWLNDLTGGGSFSELDKAAEARKDSARDLYFLPYLAGSSGIAGSAKGGFYGLTLAHGRAEMAYAVMEGVAFEVRRTLDEFARRGQPVTSLRMTGRTAKSALWRGLVANVTGCEIEVAGSDDACIVGAAALAAAGAKEFPSVAAASRALDANSVVCTAAPADTEKYEEFLEITSRF